MTSTREFLRKRDERHHDLFVAIGRFIYWFSQLEDSIRTGLGIALDLHYDQFDVILGPYDFAMLCTVAEKTHCIGADAKRQKRIKDYFNQCRSLNQGSRVVIAHGTWSYRGAKHLSRQKLEAQTHFRFPKEINAAADLAFDLLQGIDYYDYRKATAR